ncbi:histidine kinase [Solwaraspora sp. WMMD792]|uniref:sensor histidine kinase n=1 Tax=Solwaraspora sp. WMMD792 TaxID=3016099 RepID=UPI0024171DCA|nr:histidine kinase [Solwaraspora sp. WMMD792]MDG4772431.1 histidine kinase [Solwaraspora sp. WMMD792]
MRAFWARHSWLGIWPVVLFCLALGFDTGIGFRLPQTWDWWAIGVNTVVALSLLAWRSRPWWVLLVVVAGDLVSESAQLIPFMVVSYSLAVYRSTRAGIIGGVVTVVVMAGENVVRNGYAALQPVALPLIAAAVGSVLVGVNVATRRRYLHALLDRATRLAREKEQEGQLAAGRERARIARDMHDIVAHNLTMMVRLADGATAVADSDPQRSRAAVERLANLGREAMKDMRRLLGVLRDGGLDTPGDLETLVETFRIAGLPVTLRRRGSDVESAGLQRVVFRVVQESLTNALRYAEQPTEVRVDLDYSADPIRVEITDDGRGSAPAPSVGSEQGLIALAERVALYGGTVETGRRPIGWAVRVTLPHPSKNPDEQEPR